MFFNKAINEDYFKVLKAFPVGLYSESKIFSFLKNISSTYMSNSDITKSNFKVKDTEPFKGLYDSLLLFYSPCRHTNEVIYDIMNNYNCILVDSSGEGTSGIKLYNCNQKKIFYLGGINSLLPFIELIRKSFYYIIIILLL